MAKPRTYVEVFEKHGVSSRLVSTDVKVDGLK